MVAHNSATEFHWLYSEFIKSLYLYLRYLRNIHEYCQSTTSIKIALLRLQNIHLKNLYY